ncbi:Fpg/Nei family DNA glycosylase [Nostocoides sp. F2B08]|uniref:Fpg/Nei family DNA glycosylase n=1 Tax=Nostocoides sp. F2B08 TaxID=2653936 RepID=UPI001263BBBF|nr:DNA-formamidopyrimidine glycosylase family protein [Tetrasphaera sp. F2B08]KAB7746480.1 Fpg/Nei family DNA glycosylase [Tetrasphaera sp. F2B08]
MPEGHTLHRLALALEEAFAGTRPRATSPQGRFVEGAAILDGRFLERVDAWGKHLFLTYADDVILNVHLGLIGVFDVSRHGGPDHVPPPVGAVRLRLEGETHVADLRGATLVEIVTPEELDATVARLGPDPLRAGTDGNDPERAIARLARTGRTIAEALMDQSIVAGVGNVYRSEVLFRHRVNPLRPAREIRPATFRAIWDDLVALLPLGVAFGQIITMEHQVEQAQDLLAAAQGEPEPLPVDAGGPGEATTAYPPRRPTLVRWQGAAEGERGRRPAYESASPFPREYYVYKRAGAPCHVCGSKVRTQVVAGRNLFWCGRCQRRR